MGSLEPAVKKRKSAVGELRKVFNTKIKVYYEKLKKQSYLDPLECNGMIDAIKWAVNAIEATPRTVIAASDHSVILYAYKVDELAEELIFEIKEYKQICLDNNRKSRRAHLNLRKQFLEFGNELERVMKMLIKGWIKVEKHKKGKKKK